MIPTLAPFAVLLSNRTPTMTTLTPPLDRSVPQPHLHTLRDTLKGRLHFPGDQTYVVSFEMPFVEIVD